MKDSMKGWSDCKVAGSKGFVLFSKAKAAKISLKNWIKAKKEKLQQSADLEEKLGEVDEKAGVEGWTEALRLQRRKLLEMLWKILRREEQEWSSWEENPGE